MQIQAQQNWRTIDFISDTHLDAHHPETFAAWKQAMLTSPADAIFLLGDLFEVWLGDDVLTYPKDDLDFLFEKSCVDVIHQASLKTFVFVMHGNRDFLMGDLFAQMGNCTLIDDPTILNFSWGDRILLSHGDALCLGDKEYQVFRSLVRNPQWQASILSKSIAERMEFSKKIRSESTALKESTTNYADADKAMTLQWLQEHQAQTIIHGHTHQPAEHDAGQSRRRIVLSDWNANANPPRAQILRLSVDQNSKQALKFDRIDLFRSAN